MLYQQQLNQKLQHQLMNVFVINFGGGTLDISVVAVSKNKFYDITHAGESFLGGEDFDQSLVNYFKFKIKASKNIDLSNDKEAIQKLQIEAQRVKEALSEKEEVNIQINDVIKGFHFIDNINRQRFEAINEGLFNRIKTALKTAFEESNLDIKDIHEVILVGGLNRIPKIQEIIQEFFKGIPIRKDRINDELICAGAAIRGGIISQKMPYKYIQIIEVERTSISFGVETVGGYMSKIIPKGTIYPTKLSKKYTINHDYQEEILIQIYQGESYRTLDNEKIGEFILSGIQRAKKQIPQIEVTFELDLNGILDVTVIDLDTKSQQKHIVTTNKMRSSQEEIEQQKENNKREQEKLSYKRESTIRVLDLYINRYQNQFQSSDFEKLWSKDELDSMKAMISAISKWFQQNKNDKKIKTQEFEEQLQNFKRIEQKIKEKIKQMENPSEVKEYL
ncbi:unnamed protein product [Paramecium sonneborni]|uniref:Heat shock protein 70 n=1 Tax=Paramecium sonneborni TaxID=65129 RepID=A0A8S1RG87_9CILI|nr:unnamed protein product [Paramecium sonneborni]